MGEVHPLPDRRSEFIVDGDHSELRATWHLDAGLVVISLWRGDTCVATSRLTPSEAARLGGFITTGLADLATHAPHHIDNPHPDDEASSQRTRAVEEIIRSLRSSLAGSLDAMARRIGP